MFRTITKSILLINLQTVNNTIRKSIIRNYANAPKRFYKTTNVLYSDGKYEISLDHRKLKTPKGLPFQVESEPLAIACAAEWDSQKEKIQRSSMHLNELCNTVIDNPNNLQRVDLVNYLMNYVPTDTILFQSMEEEELYKLQMKEWDPVIEWFNKRYDCDITKSTTMIPPNVSAKTRMNISKHLQSYDMAALQGFVFAVDSLKSIVLTFACVDRFITSDRAVLLSRLEEEFQLGFWGRVEWAHDLHQLELQTRVSAAILFIYFNSSSYLLKEKMLN